MDVLILTIIVAGGLFYLHRRDRAAVERAAYSRGWDACEEATQKGARHGLKPLPIEEATWQTDN